MGVGSCPISGTRCTVTGISAEIDSDGRLIRADEQLLQLNRRAGGQQGSILAIPPLLALVQLAVKLRMRLSRAVRVADETDLLELWVEVDCKEEFISLSILSWRAIQPHEIQPARSAFRHEAAHSVQSILRFDRSLRLVSANGSAIEGLTASDFGQAGSAFLSRYFQNADVVASLLAAMQTGDEFSPAPVTRSSDEARIMIAGRPLLDADGNESGYECSITPALEEEAIAVNATPTAAAANLLGTHLAPALHQPLNRIIANAETIGSEMQGPIRENYAVYARDIVNAARHLSSLVADLSDLEVIERPDFTTAPDHIELGDVARRVAGLLALKAAERNLRIVAPSGNIQVRAVAEFRRVLQIMLNLVGNAIRYAQDGTEITIAIFDHGDDAVITVDDQGPGIDAGSREKIFDKFERLGRSGDGGSGLGLYISRHLARTMHGDLTVEEGQRGGAKFILRLPAHNHL